MEKDISSFARQLLGEEGSKAVSGKSAELEKLADSPDGQKVKQMLESSGELESAIASSDTDALKKALSNVLKTQEGMRLASQLGSMFNGK
jgi:hypothetical protein